MWPRWVRGIITLWVAYDSQNRKGLDLFWVLVLFLLGPLLLPFYLAARPLLKDENRRGGFFWNAFWNFEKLLSTLAGLAASAVFIENMMESENKEVAVVKRAEIKAGSITGVVAVVFGFVIERLFFDIFRKTFEKEMDEESGS